MRTGRADPSPSRFLSAPSCPRTRTRSRTRRCRAKSQSPRPESGGVPPCPHHGGILRRGRVLPCNTPRFCASRWRRGALRSSRRGRRRPWSPGGRGGDLEAGTIKVSVIRVFCRTCIKTLGWIRTRNLISLSWGSGQSSAASEFLVSSVYVISFLKTVLDRSLSNIRISGGKSREKLRCSDPVWPLTFVSRQTAL